MANLTKLIGISMIGLCLINPLHAQSYEDFALTYSKVNTGGSARINALGGSQVALGGDVSSISGNPAGLGFYNRSDISFTPNVFISNNRSSYRDNTVTDGNTGFNFTNISVVTNFDIEENSTGWKTHSLGFSLNRVNTFENRFTYRGSTVSDDFTGYALSEANQVLPGNQNRDPESYLPDLAVLAWGAYLIDPIDTTGDGLTDFYDSQILAPNEDFPYTQEEQVTTDGSQTAISASYGANYKDKVYVGIGVSLYSINQEIERRYTENFRQTVIDQFTLNDSRTVNGTGVNARVGIIGRPVSFLTIGLSYQTPTVTSINESSRLDLESFFNSTWDDPDDTGLNPSYGLEYDRFSYSLRTPGRVTLGGAAFLGKLGFATVDVEYTDYGQARLISGDQALESANENINAFFNATLTYRGGVEIRINKFRARGGAGFREDPVRNDFSDTEFWYSGGLGYRSRGFYIDLTYRVQNSNDRIRPYPTAPFARLDQTRSNILATVGFLF